MSFFISLKILRIGSHSVAVMPVECYSGYLNSPVWLFLQLKRPTLDFFFFFLKILYSGAAPALHGLLSLEERRRALTPDSPLPQQMALLHDPVLMSNVDL